MDIVRLKLHIRVSALDESGNNQAFILVQNMLYSGWNSFYSRFLMF